MSEYIIEAKSISKSYDDGEKQLCILDSINLSIEPSKMVSIVGSSGSGKSTLLHILGTLDTPTSGAVLSNGTNLSELSKNSQAEFRNASLGFVYQFHHLLPEFTALENIAMPLFIRGENRAKSLESAHQLIVKVGLGQREKHYPAQLSGGERQRVAIARALINEPLVVLADEPTGNLDARSSLIMFDLIQQINDELKTAFVVVTHDMKLAKNMHVAYQLTNAKLEEIAG